MNCTLESISTRGNDKPCDSLAARECRTIASRLDAPRSGEPCANFEMWCSIGSVLLFLSARMCAPGTRVVLKVWCGWCAHFGVGGVEPTNHHTDAGGVVAAPAVVGAALGANRAHVSPKSPQRQHHGRENLLSATVAPQGTFDTTSNESTLFWNQGRKRKRSE